MCPGYNAGCLGIEDMYYVRQTGLDRSGLQSLIKKLLAVAALTETMKNTRTVRWKL